MSQKFNVRISMSITTSDGEPFADNVVDWHGMSRQGVLGLEQIMIGVFAQLNQIGQEAEQARGNAPAHSQAGGKKR